MKKILAMLLTGVMIIGALSGLSLIHIYRQGSRRAS